MMLRIITVAYERPIPLRILVDSFMVQTDNRWEMNIIHDGKASAEIINTLRLYKGIKNIKYSESQQRYGHYGHPNRRAVLSSIQCCDHDYILITNDDNYYVPKFVEYFLAETSPSVGIVYCNTVHSHINYNTLESRVALRLIDMGSFIVRADIAKRVGFIHDEFHADGLYAEECKRECILNGLSMIKINKSLFVHN